MSEQTAQLNLGLTPFQCSVLDKGFVRVIDTMGTDKDIVLSARVSYAHREDTKVMEDGDRRLMQFLIREGHWAPFRHVFLKFHIKLPDVVMRHLAKHVVSGGFVDAPLSEKSGRYVQYQEFYIPEKWRQQSKDSKQGSSGLVEDQGSMAQLYESHLRECVDVYQRMIDAGVAKEMCRMVLPFSTYTEVYYTLSLQAALHLVRLRDDAHAQWETQEYARAIKGALYQYFPETMLAIDELGMRDV